jgi:deazaflavin-dependent oxidoreductase (nitroreductase family)
VPLPRWLARSNRWLANPVLSPAAARLPYFGVLVHRGRRSGRRRRTPLNVFPDDGGFVVALTYGRGTEWAGNIMAAGGCELIHRGRRIRLTSPHLLEGSPPPSIPGPARAVLRAIGVRTFLRLDRARPDR